MAFPRSGVYGTLLLALSGTALTAWSRVPPPQLVRPLGLDLYVPVPVDNPVSPAKLALGQRLFHERRLSADGRTSCATCHRPDRAFTDGRSVARGVFGRAGRRNVPSIFNRAYGAAFFWDGRAATLEDQVRRAIAGDGDLGLPVGAAADRLSGDASYGKDFEAAFEAPVTADRMVQAIATFVRATLSGGSPFDRFFAGQRNAMTPAARRGYVLFTDRAGCGGCHAGPLFSDEQFHNTGVSWGRDAGRFEVTRQPEDLGRFKTPSLRNVALTAPYMHDGSLGSLDAVVEFYDRGAGDNPNLDSLVKVRHLSASDRADLVAFLRSLTGSSKGKE